MEEEFQEGLRRFFKESFAQQGVMGASILSPPPGSDSREFGILRTFASEKERNEFYASPEFLAWDEKARTMTEGEPVYRKLHGLEAWFHSPQPPPPRWKMALATLIGVYPTSLFLSLTLGGVTTAWPLLLRSLLIAVAMVALLTWGVMPAVTRLLRPWLQPRTHQPTASSAEGLVS
jgi:antibiotic biosynthesis monooxygenase (ABM) superfamily enzyme